MFYYFYKNIVLNLYRYFFIFFFFFYIINVHAQSVLPGSRLENLRKFKFDKPNIYKLKNGLILVVDVDKRAPVVNHTIWYRVGSADEKEGETGIAHFLEHLMFRGTDQYPEGYFSKRISQIGGNDNAFTTHDLTAYYQNIPNTHLREVMEMEANRMRYLKISENELSKERDIVLEERALRVDTKPASQLIEQMNVLLFRNHPYGKPVIGWKHEISDLNKQQVMKFYNKYYAPNNVIVTVVGDVNPNDVYHIAQKAYGNIEPSKDIQDIRMRPQEPPQVGAREITLHHQNVTTETLFFMLEDLTKATNDAPNFSLTAALNCIAGGAHSILYKKLVKQEKIALDVNVYTNFNRLDKSGIIFQLTPTQGTSLERLKNMFQSEIQEILKKGLKSKDIEREKNILLASYISSFDSRTNRSYFWGENLALNRDISKIIDFPTQISLVTSKKANKMIENIFVPHNQVWGYLKVLE